MMHFSNNVLTKYYYLFVASCLVKTIYWCSEGSLHGELGVVEWYGVEQEGSDATLCHSSSWKLCMLVLITELPTVAFIWLLYNNYHF